MAQQHLDRLTALDASFLHQEGPSSHMHVGALCRVEGPPPPFDELLDALRMRLHLVPRYRQRLRLPPAGTGRPLWVDDPTFDIEYHVRHTALPRPGSEYQLLRLAGRVFSQQLDRDRPLWEMWMVEGLEDGGFALLSKTHHAMIDGISGVDIAQVMFDLSPVPAEVDHPDAPWQPARSPSPAEVLAAGGLGLLRSGVRTEGLELRALVPVSIRGSQDRGSLGNRIAAMRGPLPVYIEDPLERLRAVRAAMDGLKESKQAVGAEVLASVQNLAPPTILAQASRLNFSTRLFNLIVTNVPGPQMPLYVLGRELQDLFPIAFLPRNHALAIAVMSYNGRMDFGLLGDYDAMPDLETVAEALRSSLAELRDAARPRPRSRRRQPV